ncbi:cytochrome b/b6 domain-containing protein [Bradyrhizobium sediminis]|uniref:Cytochrome b/b6 domain-containing protein n=1 Tax=Bradyrhizobium sediminis TaxID=2840469 RepID=A0A975NPL2_9BRAD|nr:cytochrome b/b6 domain-containing protein [Bradyrhizobium sediminis]QWG18279.1 cytochrome b/b6 domain-containing protein [Bradyrhizobium sediminis]
MAFTHDAIEAGGAVPPATVKVWDPFVRMFHWTLLTLFVIAFVTGDEIEGVHIAAGYGIATLLALRLAWGVIGPRHARFSSFVRSPRDVLAYLRDVARLKAPRYLGHNPAGGAMIVALLAALIGTAVTGYMMTTDAYWGAKWVEKLHEALAHGTLVLAGLHVLGVAASSLLHRENLVKAMVTGRKRSS